MSPSLFRRITSLVQRAAGGVVPIAQSVFSSLWGGVGIGVRETFAGAWQSSDRYADVVQERSPLAFSAVYTAITIISSDIAKLPLRILKDREDGGGREPHQRHPLNRVLLKPNTYQTSLQFLQQYMTSKLWTGNTYVLLFRDARGVVESMHVLDPQTVTPAITQDGSVWYLVKANALNRLAEDQYIPARDILHDRAATLFHPLVGVSPLYAAAISAQIGNRIAGHSATFFKNLSRASGVLSAPGDIPPATADRLKAEWDGNYSGPGFGKVAVLGSGLEWKPLTMNAVDAQLIEQLRWAVADIGRVYRIPVFMLGETNIQYKNNEQLSRMYFNGCLSYHIEAMEQCFRSKFELDGSTHVKFDLAPLFRMETDVRYSTHRTALTSGIKSINEVRAEEDLPPVKGGEEPRLQMQYVPLSQANELMKAQQQQPGSSKPTEPAEEPSDSADDEQDSEDDASDKDKLFEENMVELNSVRDTLKQIFKIGKIA